MRVLRRSLLLTPLVYPTFLLTPFKGMARAVHRNRCHLERRRQHLV
jgi:hypothetical protein